MYDYPLHYNGGKGKDTTLYNSGAAGGTIHNIAHLNGISQNCAMEWLCLSPWNKKLYSRAHWEILLEDGLKYTTLHWFSCKHQGNLSNSVKMQMAGLIISYRVQATVSFLDSLPPPWPLSFYTDFYPRMTVIIHKSDHVTSLKFWEVRSPFFLASPRSACNGGEVQVFHSFPVGSLGTWQSAFFVKQWQVQGGGMLSQASFPAWLQPENTYHYLAIHLFTL